MSNDKLNKVETIREKTGVTYEEAREALDQCGGDVLDAIVWLEKSGKARVQASAQATASAGSTNFDESPALSAEMVRAQQEYEESTRKTQFGEVFQSLMDWLKGACRRGLEVSFIAERDGAQVFSIPVLVLVILMLFLFPATVPLLIVGLFFRFRYRFEGVGKMVVDVNDAMDKAADSAETIRRDVMGK